MAEKRKQKTTRKDSISFGENGSTEQECNEYWRMVNRAPSCLHVAQHAPGAFSDTVYFVRSLPRTRYIALPRVRCVAAAELRGVPMQQFDERMDVRTHAADGLPNRQLDTFTSPFHKITTTPKPFYTAVECPWGIISDFSSQKTLLCST